MTAITITHFGGELPSTSARALPPTAAQTNRNLYLGTAEFRPLLAHTSAGSATSNAQTLYRFNGNFLSFTDQRSYVRGQINEEKTERTYYTFNTGSARPRTINNQGADRELGVWRPAKPAVTLQEVDEITPQEAQDFIYGDLTQSVFDAFEQSIRYTDRNSKEARWSGNHTLVGAENVSNYLTVPTASHGTSYANALAQITSAQAQHIDVNALGAIAWGSGGYLIPLKVAPIATYLDKAQLSSLLAALTYPAGFADKSGSPVFTVAQAAEVTQAFASKSVEAHTKDTKIRAMRDELSEIAKEFSELILTKAWNSPIPTKPTPPTKPTVPEWPPHFA